MDLEKRATILSQLGNAQAMFNGAKKEDAKKFAPITFKKTEMSLKNAAANSEEKWVHLNFQAHDGKTNFVITDSGPPLNSEVQEHIFTPFFTNKPEGLGLALVVAKSILEDYKSELTLHSVAPNTSFQIMFHTPKISNA